MTCDMNYLMRLFYSIRLKDYFAMLSEYVDKKYISEYKMIGGYSDADNRYLIHKSKKNPKINPEVTIGEMLYIAFKLKSSDEYDDLDVFPFPPSIMALLSYRITKGIMVTPFYEMFETDKGKRAFEAITDYKFTTKENE